MNDPSLSVELTDRLAPETKIAVEPMHDYRSWFLIGLIFALVINFSLFGYLAYRNVQEPRVKLIDLRITGSLVLCPNEDLIYVMVVGMDRPTEVTITGTMRHTHHVMNEDGDQIIHLHTMSVEKFQSETSGQYRITRYFKLPVTMIDPISGLSLPWEPGPYEWQIVVNPSGYYSTDMRRVPFTVREGCPGV